MRFMIIRKADKDTEAAAPPSEDLFAAMTAYNEELAEAGMLLAGEGLHPTSNGARVRFSKGEVKVIDGPFTEAKELIAGFTIIQASSKEEALEWVKRWPPLDGGGEVELEVRQLFDPDDFGDALTPELREREEAMRIRIADQTR